MDADWLSNIGRMGGISAAYPGWPLPARARAALNRHPLSLSDAKIVHPLQRSSAHAADHRVAIAAHQRIGHWPGTGGAVKVGGRFVFGHTDIMACPTRPRRYFAGAIDCTWMVFPAASSVPVTVTFLAANFSGVFWSLST